MNNEKNDLNELTISALGQLSASSEFVLARAESNLKAAAMRETTALPFFDEATHGGLYNGLTVIAGLPGAGKTTLLVQLAVERSLVGLPTVYVTKDMSKTEVLLKAIGYSLGAPVDTVAEHARFIGLGMMNRDFRQYLENVVILEPADEDFLTAINSGVELEETSNVGKMVEVFTKYFAPKRPVFVFDSLQSMALSPQYTAKDGVDLALLEFKRLQRKFDAPFVLVSNLARSAYNSEITMASLKESGNIEYEASCVLALEPKEHYADYNHFRDEDVRYMCIKNLKDRVGGYKRVELAFKVSYGKFLYAAEERRNAAELEKMLKDASMAGGGNCCSFGGVPVASGSDGMAGMSVGPRKKPKQNSEAPQKEGAFAPVEYPKPIPEPKLPITFEEENPRPKTEYFDAKEFLKVRKK